MFQNLLKRFDKKIDVSILLFIPDYYVNKESTDLIIVYLFVIKDMLIFVLSFSY